MSLFAVWTALNVTWACVEPAPALFPDASPPGAGEAVWMWSDRTMSMNDFTVQVNGAVVDGETSQHEVGRSGFVAFLPDTPLEEGDEVVVTIGELIANDAGTPIEPMVHTVVASHVGPWDTATVDEITFGEVLPAEENSCGFFDERQRIDVTVSWGPSDGPARLVLVDALTDELLDYVIGDAAGGSEEVIFYAEPGQADLCLRVDQLQPDASVGSLAEMFCVDNPAPAEPDASGDSGFGDQVLDGCGCTSAGGAAASWVVLLTLMPVVRRRSRAT